MSWFGRVFGLNSCDYSSGLSDDAMYYTEAMDPTGVDAKIWSIGGGKGGVGKSLITGNLGISLSRNGKRVLLVDADFGAANLHTVLGIEGGKKTLSTFIKGEIKSLEDVISKTTVQGLDLISGAKDSLDAADFKANSVSLLRGELSRLDYDCILIDMGPGTSSIMTEIFLMADKGILVVSPDPTSIENSYRFLKCLLLSGMKNIIATSNDRGSRAIFQDILNNGKNGRPRTIAAVISAIKDHDIRLWGKIEELFKRLMIYVLVNQIRYPEDEKIGQSFVRVCYDYFGLEVEHAGNVAYDDCIIDSVRRRRPLSIHYSHSSAADSILRTASMLVRDNKKRKSAWR